MDWSFTNLRIQPENNFRGLKWDSVKRESGCVVSLGNFDGVHIGHQALLIKLIEQSRKRNLDPVIVTFFPHPKSLLDKCIGSFLLNAPWEKQTLPHRLYDFEVYFIDFSPELAALSPQDFFQQFLIEGLKAEELVLGPDYRFGAGAAGDIPLLKSSLEKMGKFLSVVPEVKKNKLTVSSTLIRKLLGEGEIRKANELLGHVFFYSGVVVEGDKRGAGLGFPTANLDPCFSDKIMVKDGVYGGRAIVDGEFYDAVINIGKNPTFKTQNTQIEAHILQFDKYIYGQNLTIELNSYIREEIKFNSREELVLQIENDIEQFKSDNNKKR